MSYLQKQAYFKINFKKLITNNRKKRKKLKKNTLSVKYETNKEVGKNFKSICKKKLLN